MTGDREERAAKALRAAEELVSDGRLSVEQAIELTGLSRSELYARMKAGDLPFTKDGKRRLIPRRALVTMMARTHLATQN